jgi:predicted house-cleaning noncanonical NTP pyrophosphatase (MazG superfamily)
MCLLPQRTHVNTTAIRYKNASFPFSLPALTPSSEHSVIINPTNASRKMLFKIATWPQYKDLVEAALQAEVQSFKDNKVFASFHNLSELDLFAEAPGFRKLQLNFLCSEKFDERGELQRLKAHGIADGSKQGTVSAYVMRASSGRMIVSKAAQDGYTLGKGLPFSKNGCVLVSLSDKFMLPLRHQQTLRRLPRQDSFTTSPR